MLRYHEDSGLLFLRGSNQQLEFAREVLQILERDLKERSKIASMQNRGSKSRPTGKSKTVDR